MIEKVACSRCQVDQSIYHRSPAILRRCKIVEDYEISSGGNRMHYVPRPVARLFSSSTCRHAKFFTAPVSSAPAPVRNFPLTCLRRHAGARMFAPQAARVKRSFFPLPVSFSARFTRQAKWIRRGNFVLDECDQLAHTCLRFASLFARWNFHSSTDRNAGL